MKLKSFLFIISCFAYFNIIAQSAIIPNSTDPILLWENPDGTSGSCTEGSTGNPVCTTTICLGESICFSYDQQFFPYQYPIYSLNHTTLSFSDGGSIVAENVNYNGPNPTGCVQYAPTSIGVITVTGLSTAVFYITVLPSSPPVLSANITPPNSICEGSQVCAQALTFPSVNYSFSSATDLGCFNGNFCNTPNTTAFCFPAGNHQILYTVNAGHTCSNTAVYNVNVVPSTLALSVTTPPACANNYCFNATASAACNLGNLNYTWDISDNNGNTYYSQTNSLQSVCLPLSPGTYNITVYAGSNLYAFTTITVPPVDACVCQSCTNPIGTSGIISTSPAPNQQYCINNNVTITSNVTFSNSEFKIDANAIITIANNAVLTINHSHLYSGTNMWNGIVILNGGKLNIENNSLIEDAVNAVSITNHTTQSLILKVDASIFNKNRNSIVIKGYTQNITTYPFTITNSVFTCRNIFNCSVLGGWPTTATFKANNNPVTSALETPYINNVNFPVTTLKAPFAGQKPLMAITIATVGVSNVTTSSAVYRDIIIGTTTGLNTYNVFDNHFVDIEVIRANVTVVNSVFQNSYTYLTPAAIAAGIRAGTGASNASSANSNFRLQVSSSNYTNNNKFYNVKRAVSANNIHELAVNYCEMYSSRIFNPAVASQQGAYGLIATSNHYNSVNMNYNKVFNIDNALVFNSTVGSYSVGTTTSGNGQYLGSIYANNNIIRSHVTGNTPNPTLHYGFKGISITGLISSNTVTQPNATIQTNDNNIFDYENGISCSNWNPMGVITKLNTITIRNKATNVYQYGIEHVNNTLYPFYSFKTYGIIENNVTANAISITTNNYAIRSVQNGNYSVLCNTVTNTYNGLAFSGTHINDAFARFNFMTTNRYGFVLENSGIIGPQGSSAPDGSAYFAENQWLGNWIAPNYKTATINSNAQLSKMYVRTVPPTFNPNGSAYTNLTAGMNDYYYNGTVGTILTVPIEGTFTNCYLGKPAPTNPNIAALEKIAANGAANGIEHAIARFVAKSQLFVYLQNNPTAKKPGILTGFYNSNKHKYRDRFFDVETNVAEGDINTAKNAVAAFNPANGTEDKHKQFFDALFKYQNQTLTANDEQTLLQLSNGCPYLDGTVVHQARALYNLVTEQNVSFTDSCDYNTQSNARLGKIEDEVYDEETTMQGNEVFLYPNPSNGSDIFISIATSELESVDVTVNNINGLAISKETITLTNGIGKLNIKSANGVYMVIITNNKTNERVIKKLVIQK